MARFPITYRLKLNKRLALSRPLTCEEGDENWCNLERELQRIITQVNVALTEAVGELVPKASGIIATDGTILPSGLLDGTQFYYLCDGLVHNGIPTPDMRNRNILGADSDELTKTFVEGDFLTAGVQYEVTPAGVGQDYSDFGGPVLAVGGELFKATFNALLEAGMELEDTPEFLVGDSGGLDQALDHVHVDPDSGAVGLSVPQLPVHNHPTLKNGKPLVYGSGFVQEAGKKGNPSYMFTNIPPETEDETQTNGSAGASHDHPSGGDTGLAGAHDNKPRYYALAWVKYCRNEGE
jgi:hypothetical protein